MGYVKNTWVDQDVERPKTYEVTTNQDGSITLTDSFGLVTELGTPVNATNMNHIENGLALSDLMKYDATVTYSTGEWVTGVVNNEKGIYASLVDNNVGNALSDDTKWEEVQLGGATRNIGEIVTSTIPLTDAGLHLLDGALISGSGSYADFVTYIAGLVSTYPDLFDTEANWQSAITTYGVCGKFVYDSVNNTVRLPKVTGIIEGTTDATALGDLVEAGLPNHRHIMFQASGNNTDISSSSFVGSSRDTGGSAGYMMGQKTNEEEPSLGKSGLVIESNIYGNSNTVQPQTIKVLYYIVVATSSKTDIQVDIDEIATDLNGKADINLSNVSNTSGFRKLVEIYNNSTSWYKVYSEYNPSTGDYIGQWCEQGGVHNPTTTTTYINLLKNYKDTNYNCMFSWRYDAHSNNANTGTAPYSTSKIVVYDANYGSGKYITWQACGYIS